MQKFQTCKKVHNQRKHNRGFSVSEKYKLGTLQQILCFDQTRHFTGLRNSKLNKVSDVFCHVSLL